MNKIFFRLLLLFVSSLFVGTIIIQYGDNIAIDSEVPAWKDDNHKDTYPCRGNNPLAFIHYFSSNRSLSRYYYKIPLPIILTEAPVNSIFFNIVLQR